MMGCHLQGLETAATCQDPHPIYLLEYDNTAGESWLTKGCTSSATGQELARLQTALLLDQGVCYRFGCVDTKTNVIADGISCIPSEHTLPHEFPPLLTQPPSLNGCWRYLPNAALISSIVDVLLQNNCMDPLSASKQLLTYPGRFTSSHGVTSRPTEPVHSRAASPRLHLHRPMLRSVPHLWKNNHGHADSICHSLWLRHASTLPSHQPRATKPIPG